MKCLNGKLKVMDFKVVKLKMYKFGEGEVLVKNLFVFFDVGFCNWMDEEFGDNVLLVMLIGKLVMGLILG